jgi:hypothetical protein
VSKNSSRRSNLRFGNYRSLRAAYLDLKPDMTYLTFYKRVKAGLTPDEATNAPLRKQGRKRRKPLPWEGPRE